MILRGDDRRTWSWLQRSVLTSHHALPGMRLINIQPDEGFDLVLLVFVCKVRQSCGSSNSVER